MPFTFNYHQAVVDFHDARRKAQLQEVVSRLTGEPNELLSYEEVRKKLKAIEGSTRTLEEIPLDAIVGSVGRYTDFTRDFLPRHDSDQLRWASVMEQAIGMEGLPPIEVYKIGDTYFVKDGNHRVSVARQLDASHIQGYVTEVNTRVPLSPDIKPDELIIKAEQASFLERTQLDKLRPDADLTVTIPGQYPILEEHISVHRYFMGIEQDSFIPYSDAVIDWYDQVYLPVIKIICERAILKNFPQRTETDLYLWLSRHKADLEDYLEWPISTEKAAEDLALRFARDFTQSVSQMTDRILDAVTPDPLESGPPVGFWREEHIQKTDDISLFNDILVALSRNPEEWYAFDQAVPIAQREISKILGLHIFQNQEEQDQADLDYLRGTFSERCRDAGVWGEIAFEVGGVARIICERAQWADMIIAKLAHPPGDNILNRFDSGFRTMIRRCSVPILAVPCNVTGLNRLLLAFNDSPKAMEALYIAAYLAGKWDSHLTVLSVDTDTSTAEQLQEPARKYLTENHVQADFITRPDGPIAEIILDTADELGTELLLMGGYKARPIVEVVFGSLVDEVLREITFPVLICR
jgi:nucleotide-binding universal stress UspA family protein